MATTTATATRSRQATGEVKAALKPVVDGPQYPDIQSIRDAIPAHCFVPSTWRSLGYLVRDVAMAAALGWAALAYIPRIQDTLWRTAAWIVYGYAQGLVCTGIWILAHEAGHGAFSVHRRLNDAVGWAAHSALLVPYFSWKFSHHRHHRFTGHMDKDMAFVPHTRADRQKRRLAELYLDRELFEDVPVVQLVKLLAHQLAGWQMYLLFNVSAGVDSQQRKGSWWRVSHFEPTSAVFRPSEAMYIALSDLGLAITFGVLYLASTVVGWKMVFLLYGVPYFWVHHWLGMFLHFGNTLTPLIPYALAGWEQRTNNTPVAITYLHHTHPDVHHFDADGWTFVKGALATVDRDFGFVGRHLFHGIIDTHVVHHLFPSVSVP
ncbi:hypothetical protein VTK56DRAFT_7912 [Thermocarpiscus australiensis]